LHLQILLFCFFKRLKKQTRTAFSKSTYHTEKTKEKTQFCPV